MADLGSDSRAVRARAEAALVEHGTGALDLLPNESTLDPAVRETLERIVRTVEDAEAQKALIPREVRLRSKQLAEILGELEQQTGNSIPRPDKLPELAQLPPDEPLTFWQVIDWIESHSELRYGGHQLQTAKQRSPASSQGPVSPFAARSHGQRDSCGAEAVECQAARGMRAPAEAAVSGGWGRHVAGPHRRSGTGGVHTGPVANCPPGGMERPTSGTTLSCPSKRRGS